MGEVIQFRANNFPPRNKRIEDIVFLSDCYHPTRLKNPEKLADALNAVFGKKVEWLDLAKCRSNAKQFDDFIAMVERLIFGRVAVENIFKN